MNDYSQAGQTTFVKRVLIDTGIAPVGNFLDIGCAGLSISNTLGLEELGWRGTLVDNSPEAQADSKDRTSDFILADATKLDYSFLPPIVDYLSLDIDFGSLAALKQLPLDNTRFRVITVEHDSWRFEDTLRVPMLELLIAHGYTIVCADVCNPFPFEIWAVDISVPGSVWMPFVRNEPTYWKEILSV